MVIKIIILCNFFQLLFISDIPPPENEKGNLNSAGSTIPKPKKFFKSRNNDPPDIPPVLYSEKSELSYGNVSKKQKVNNSERETKSKKFFASKHSNHEEKTVLSSNTNNSKRGETKPPIVLRICRGKSQLLNDSDESESTPTPSSTPSTSNVTSPRALKENPQRSPSARITRSTRRSMQQDPHNSPAKADTPTEFSLFTSPKNDLSPQYIPAEKYELERKAMYDNLLRPNSRPSSPDIQINIPTADLNSNLSIPELNKEEGNNTDQGEADMEIEEETARGSIIVPEANDTSTNSEVDDTDTVTYDNLDSKQNDNLNSTNDKQPEATPKKNIIEEDWSTDEDSNSTAPDLEEKGHLTPVRPSIEEHKDEILDKILEKPTDAPAPVKLVISKKKGSIFKSRSMVADGSKKRRALYKHKWSDVSEKKSENSDANSVNTAEIEFDDAFDFQDEPLTRIKRPAEDDDDVIAVQCNKGDKGVYI